MIANYSYVNILIVTGEYFLCPGEGQKLFEYMHSALREVCLEEINSEIIIDKLLYVRDTMYENGENKMHHAAHFFKCDLVDMSTLRVGNKPDKSCVGLEWIELSKPKNMRFYPLLLESTYMKTEHFINRYTFNNP